MEITKERIKEIRKRIPKGTTIYAVLEHESRSGMSRTIKFFMVNKNGIANITGTVGELTGYKRPANKNGLKIDGCGMDMGFSTVYYMSSVLYDGDGYALSHQWL